MSEQPISQSDIDAVMKMPPDPPQSPTPRIENPMEPRKLVKARDALTLAKREHKGKISELDHNVAERDRLHTEALERAASGLQVDRGQEQHHIREIDRLEEALEFSAHVVTSTEGKLAELQSDVTTAKVSREHEESLLSLIGEFRTKLEETEQVFQSLRAIHRLSFQHFGGRVGLVNLGERLSHIEADLKIVRSHTDTAELRHDIWRRLS